MFELFQLGLLQKLALTFQFYSFNYLEPITGFECDLPVTPVMPTKEATFGVA